MYFGCMKNWWLCSSSLFWFQDETLQTSNVIGQGDIFYVFDKWSLNSFKYIKIFLCWCQFTIEVLWILHVYHKVLGGFVSSKIRLPTSDLYGFYFFSQKKTIGFLWGISRCYLKHTSISKLYTGGGLHLVSTEACVQCSTNISISPLHIILHIEDLSFVLHSTSCWISA